MLLAEAGVASRRHAEEFIRAGRVTVNGQVAQLGERADPGTDRILLDGSPVAVRQETVCLLLNKPAGVVTTLSDPAGRPSVQDYVAGLPWRVFPVGRLDRDSEGLLLFTNDGMLANGLMHPRYHVPKTYRVTLDRPADLRLISRCAAEIRLEDGPVRFLSVEGRDGSRDVVVTIAEGRKRLVRRAFAALDHRVVRLVRTAIGPLTDPGLPSGSLRRLGADEVETLWAAIRAARSGQGPTGS